MLLFIDNFNVQLDKLLQSCCDCDAKLKKYLLSPKQRLNCFPAFIDLHETEAVLITLLDISYGLNRGLIDQNFKPEVLCIGAQALVLIDSYIKHLLDLEIMNNNLSPLKF
jgi:hypothetical protein